jgi:hypothetical protein
MERFNALGRGAQLMLIGGVLLFIVLFFPWQSFELPEPLSDVNWSGWRGIGVVLGLLTIVLLAWLIVRIASVNIPLPVSTAMTGALLGTLILIFAIIKLLTILGDEATIWAWIGVILAVVVAVGAFMTVQEAGGMDTLRQEASSLGGPGSSPGAATAPPTTSAPPPPAPPVEPSPPAQAPPSEAQEGPAPDEPPRDRET